MDLRTPLTAQLELTHDCNLTCQHCYNETHFSQSQPTQPKIEDLGSNHFKRIAQILAEEGIFQVTLTGGEPLKVRDRLYQALEAFQGTETAIGLNSNLTLLTENDIERLKSIDGVMTSVNSYDSKVHDQITKQQGSFQRTIKSLERLAKAGIPICANMVVSKRNKDQVYQTGIFLHDLGVQAFSIAHLVPARSAGSLHLSQVLTREQVIETLEQALELTQETGIQFKSQIALPYCLVEPHLRHLLETSSCSAGRSTIQINPYGEVSPCPSIPYSYGNILTEDLSLIWSRMRQEWNSNHIPIECQPCSLVEKCRGGCRAQSERMNGSLDLRHPYMKEPIKERTIPDGFELPSHLTLNPNVRVREEQDGIYTLTLRSDKYMQTGVNGLKLIQGFRRDSKVPAYVQQSTKEVLKTAMKNEILMEA